MCEQFSSSPLTPQNSHLILTSGDLTAGVNLTAGSDLGAGGDLSGPLAPHLTTQGRIVLSFR